MAKKFVLLIAFVASFLFAFTVGRAVLCLGRAARVLRGLPRFYRFRMSSPQFIELKLFPLCSRS